MDWRSASLMHQFRLSGQEFTRDQVAESRRTRRVKEGIRSFARVSKAFGRVGRIQMGNPGLDFGQALREAYHGEPYV